MFGFKDKPKESSNTTTIQKNKDTAKDLLTMIPNKQAREIVKDWIESENADTDYGDYRQILKKFFPGSGLLQVTNKKTGEVKMVATYTGPADDQGKKQFRDYKAFSHMLATAKGIKPPDQITVTSELGEAFGAKQG
tara:strand:+ start:571 stop:978 length:408 start_codon:yes stop_codon:yes gene_type:complete